MAAAQHTLYERAERLQHFGNSVRERRNPEGSPFDQYLGGSPQRSVRPICRITSPLLRTSLLMRPGLGDPPCGSTVVAENDDVSLSRVVTTPGSSSQASQVESCDRRFFPSSTSHSDSASCHSPSDEVCEYEGGNVFCSQRECFYVTPSGSAKPCQSTFHFSIEPSLPPRTDWLSSSLSLRK